MSLKFKEIHSLVNEIAPLIKGQKVLDFVETAPRTFVLSLESLPILFCLNNLFLRFHITEMPFIPQKSTLAEGLSQILKNKRMLDVKASPTDKIVTFYFDSDISLLCELFHKRPNLYLLQKDKILFSLNPVPSETYSIPSKPKYLSMEEGLKKSREIEAYYRLQEKKDRTLSLLKEQQKKVERKIDSLKTTKKHYLGWPMIEHKAHLIKAYLHTFREGKIYAEDWNDDMKPVKIAIDPRTTPAKVLEKLFLEAKKQKSSLPFIEKQIEENEEVLAKLAREKEKVSLADSEKDIPDKETPKKEKLKRKDPFAAYTSVSGLKILAGKSKEGNEVVTFKKAKGRDIWMHVHGSAGSHVIIQIEKNKTVQQDDLEEAYQVALYHSQAKNSLYSEILVSKRKYVSKPPKSNTGQVQVSEHKIVPIKRDILKFKAIKDRQAL